MLCKVCTAVGVALFSGASDLIAVLVHTPALAGVAVTLGWFVVALICATRDVGAWRQEGEMGKLKYNIRTKWGKRREWEIRLKEARKG